MKEVTMSNKKQSSIEWLEWQINLGLSERGLISAFKEAKAMHKEECAEVFKEAQECAVKHDGVYFKYNSIEDYYKSKETKTK